MSKYSLKFQFSPIFFLSVWLRVHQCDEMWDNCNQDNYIYHQYTVNTLKYNIIFFQKKSIVLIKCFMHFFELTNKFNFTWMSFALSTWQGQLPWAAWWSCRTNKCAVCNNSSPIHYNNCPAWAKPFSISTILKNQSRTHEVSCLHQILFHVRHHEELDVTPQSSRVSPAAAKRRPGAGSGQPAPAS